MAWAWAIPSRCRKGDLAAAKLCLASSRLNQAMLSGRARGLAGWYGRLPVSRICPARPVLPRVITARSATLHRFRPRRSLLVCRADEPRPRGSDVNVRRGHSHQQGSRMPAWALIEAIRSFPRLGESASAKEPSLPAAEGTRNIAKVAAAPTPAPHLSITACGGRAIRCLSASPGRPLNLPRQAPGARVAFVSAPRPCAGASAPRALAPLTRRT